MVSDTYRIGHISLILNMCKVIILSLVLKLSEVPSSNSRSINQPPMYMYFHPMYCSLRT